MISFCPHCGNGLAAKPPTVCARCGYEVYENARPCAGAVVLDGAGHVLAIRRAREPRAGRWDLPGGFCDEREHPADAAMRELREETGLDLPAGHLVGLYLDDYEFFGDTIATLNAYYVAYADGQAITPDPAEVAEIGWLSVAEPPELAFPHEAAVLQDVHRWLRSRE